MLKIDPQFSELIPPLLPAELALLEQSLLENGCRDSIITWNEKIVDGHNRYEICTRHSIPFKTTPITFKSRQAAKIWILRHQLGRRNPTDAARIEVASQLNLTRKEIANLANLSENTVQKYMQIKNLATPARLTQLQNGETKIGTAHRQLYTRTVKKLYTPEDAKPPTHTAKLAAIHRHITETRTFYAFLTRNFHLLNPQHIPNYITLAATQKEIISTILH
jgi:transcriptional regulator with XRE-family HTH domain